MLNTLPAIKDSFKSRWLLISAIIFFILAVLTESGLIFFDAKYQNKIYPHIFAGNIDLSGQTAEAAKMLLNAEVDKIKQRGIVFSYKDKSVVIIPLVSSIDGDLAYQLIYFNIDRAVSAAFNYGRSRNYLINLKDKMLALAGPKRAAVPVVVSQEKMIGLLKENFAGAFDAARDASLIVTKNNETNGYEFSVMAEKLGKTIDYEEAISLLISNLSNLNPAEIKLSTITEYPKILEKNSLNIASQAKKIISLAPLILAYEDSKWTVNQDQLSQFLALKLAANSSGQVKVGLDDKKFKDYLAKEIAPLTDKTPLEAKFEIKDNRVSEFQNGQDGLALNPEQSLEKIEREMEKGQPIELAVEVKPVLIKADNINSYGIKEIIGVGLSNFAGSPPNRRHNIRVGGSSLNGLLIKPGEEFSLLKALGEVSAKAGYLPELVIKENKTTPEFGGGLCQVGTTMFRSALESGLPITMRRNHSYRVQYYEPAGTDATIYNPAPDFRFINDTAAYILIQTKIAGDELSFEFWGARDGRVAEKTKPVIYNIVKPGPAKIIETLDLKPGEKKCLEKPHNGADAYFDYKVTYANGEAKEKRFSSHYVPWREVCLLGVEKLSEPDGGSATSTPPAASANPPLAN